MYDEITIFAAVVYTIQLISSIHGKDITCETLSCLIALKGLEFVK